MGNVSNEQLRAYLETFHDVYKRKASEYIPAEYQGHLLRLMHLRESSIVGYVSTIHGVGYEYVDDLACTSA